ncbi:hypothetical protein BJX63DRAFT_422027 [Aspergillus granulosus]|uniref:Uncharacterized protein n=1 Tax=Aspergillus granulosus TaxID=176169 RepID=A0ABR4H910_9EURO
MCIAMREFACEANVGSRIWIEAGEEEYTYLNLTTNSVKFFNIFRSVFYRTLWQAGFAKLRDGGFTVWCLTSRDVEPVAGYRMMGGIDFPSENFVSCDDISISKSQPEYLLDKFPKGSDTWFAAGHMWNAASTRVCRALLGYLQEIDVIAEDLPTLADSIVGFAGQQ